MGSNGVRQFRIQNIVTDVLVEPNGIIYVCEAMDRFNGGAAFIGSIDLTSNISNFVFHRANPWMPSPANNNGAIFTQLQRDPIIPGSYYALNYQSGNWGPRSRIGIVRFNQNLVTIDQVGFDIDFGPGSNPSPGTPGWMNVIPTNMEIDFAGNIFIGSYLKDYACSPAVSNCFYRHLTFSYNFASPSILANRRLQQIFGFRDFGYTQIDNDPLSRMGGAVNSLTTLNKLGRVSSTQCEPRFYTRSLSAF